MTTIRALIFVLVLSFSISTPASADFDPEIAAISSIVDALESAAKVDDPFDATRDPQWDPVFIDRLWDAENALRRLRRVMFDDPDYERLETREILSQYYNPTTDQLREMLSVMIGGGTVGPRAMWDTIFKVATLLMGRLKTPTRAARAAIAICDKLPEAFGDPRLYLAERELRIELSDELKEHLRGYGKPTDRPGD